MATRVVPQRFLDADEEPQQTLTPIEGYEKVPLVTLKEAIQPVKSLLHNADSMVETARRNCRKPADGLTCDESAAIYLYTMQWSHSHPSLFHILNKHLRSKNRQILVAWFLFLKLFFTALYKLPSYKGALWRGVRGNLSDQYDEDQIWWGVSSCTETMKIMETFVGNEGTRTLFMIECIDGKSIQSHSFFGEEKEMLLMPGSYFEVVDKWRAAKDLFMIHLRQKPSPYETIAPPFPSLSSSIEQMTISNEKKHTIAGRNYPASARSNEDTAQFPLIHSNTKWKQNGITVAGGNGQGSRFNQLHSPLSINVHDDQSIYIADTDNHRIIEWKSEANSGQVIAGGKGHGNRDDQLHFPIDVIIDKSNGSFFVADRVNRRVMQWSRENSTTGEVIISDIDCNSLTMDRDGDLYVSDHVKHEVTRWERGEKEGTIVAGGNERGVGLNQLNQPACLFVDEDYSVYVSDSDNHRVMKWMKDAKEGIVVAGGNGPGNSFKQLSYPRGLIVDQLNQVYVVDHHNARVMRWCKGAVEGTIVVGGNGEGERANQLKGPEVLCLDRQGNLYVSDCGNHRIQRYQII